VLSVPLSIRQRVLELGGWDQVREQPLFWLAMSARGRLADRRQRYPGSGVGMYAGVDGFVPLISRK
jgi:hypothetical protein